MRSGAPANDGRTEVHKGAWTVSYENGACPESVGMHDVDRRGRCHWCRRKVGAPAPRPTKFDRTEDQSYRYFYDPDFGSNRDDVY